MPLNKESDDAAGAVIQLIHEKKNSLSRIKIRVTVDWSVTFKTSLVGILLSHEYFPSWSQTRSA